MVSNKRYFQNNQQPTTNNQTTNNPTRITRNRINMGVKYSNLKCLYLPAQSGKTRKIEELIRLYTEINETFGNGEVNIIISANNKVLVKQTEGRMINNLATSTSIEENDAVIKAGVFSWMSGSNDCDISPASLTLSILDDEVEMVVMCAHPTRLKYLNDMVGMLCKSKHFQRKINIWIDEADNSIKLWSKYEAVLSLHDVKQVTLVSATFDPVFSKYGSMYVMGFYNTHPECYRRLADSVRIECNDVTSEPVDYVRSIIMKNREKLTRPGVRAFIPGKRNVSSHDAIADFLHKELNFVVVIINGKRKEILVPGGEAIDLQCYMSISDDNGQCPEELNAQLAKLYTANNWNRYPFAITGRYCIARGVTFQCGATPGVHDGFLFDYGIIPPISNNAEAYQTMARLFGNIGHLPEYKPVEIYTSTAMFNKVEKQEEMAVNLARMVHEQGLVSVGKKELKEAQNFQTEKHWDLFTGEFTTLKEANEFVKSFGARGKTDKSLKKDGEFYTSSTTKIAKVLDYATTKSEMSSLSKLSNLDVKENKSGICSRMYICYKDMSDPSSVVFICRVIKKRVEEEEPVCFKIKVKKSKN